MKMRIEVRMEDETGMGGEVRTGVRWRGEMGIEVEDEVEVRTEIEVRIYFLSYLLGSSVLLGLLVLGELDGEVGENTVRAGHLGLVAVVLVQQHPCCVAQ